MTLRAAESEQFGRSVYVGDQPAYVCVLGESSALLGPGVSVRRFCKCSLPSRQKTDGLSEAICQSRAGLRIHVYVYVWAYLWFTYDANGRKEKFVERGSAVFPYRPGRGGNGGPKSVR